jgi:sugar/nucleoside kinase (ribokinase family)
MNTVIVVGHINHDRVWSLTAPLVSGARITYSENAIRLGGGAFYTGAQLARFGNCVLLVSNLTDDNPGRTARSNLEAIGFDTRYVRMSPGTIRFEEILLEPNGERTILGDGTKSHPAFATREPISADAAYLNARMLADDLVASLDTVSLVLSQFPLYSAAKRPADIVIGSRADFPGKEVHELWAKATLIAGPRLKHLVLTDGSRPITIYDGIVPRKVTPLKLVSVRDTIGAGDSFAGIFLHCLLNGDSLEAAADFASCHTADWLSERSLPH